MSALTDLVRRTAVRSWRLAQLAVFFGYEFLYSNLMVLREILSWRGRATPALLAIPLRSRTRLEVVSIANLLTLTPGTLVVEVATDPQTLYVHVMFGSDPAGVVAQVHKLEARMLAALRPVGRGPEPNLTVDPDRR